MAMELIGRVYFIDMDGVLAVWNASASEEDTHKRGYFLDREADETAVELVKRLKDEGKRVFILSAVYEDDHSAAEKEQWLKDNGLAGVPFLFVPYGTDKREAVGSVCRYGETAILLDDYGRNLRLWEKSNDHVAVKYFNGINNLPKIKADASGALHITADTWDGYSIDHRMTVDKMYRILTAAA